MKEGRWGGGRQNEAMMRVRGGQNGEAMDAEEWLISSGKGMGSVVAAPTKS